MKQVFVVFHCHEIGAPEFVALFTTEALAEEHIAHLRRTFYDGPVPFVIEETEVNPSPASSSGKSP